MVLINCMLCTSKLGNHIESFFLEGRCVRYNSQLKYMFVDQRRSLRIFGPQSLVRLSFFFLKCQHLIVAPPRHTPPYYLLITHTYASLPALEKCASVVKSGFWGMGSLFPALHSFTIGWTLGSIPTCDLECLHGLLCWVLVHVCSLVSGPCLFMFR